jgi:hypothetical protein
MDAEAWRKLASVQALGSAMESRYTALPLDLTRYKM